jgi:hypothetical protein
MKTNILKIGKLLLLGIGVSLVSCDDWLDVRPKSEILTDIHFETENGFKDQLTGVYTAMTETSMYGRSLSFGLMSVLSQDYDLKSESTYRYAAEYNYEETGTKGMIDNIWSSTYNCIANLNVMLKYIDNDPNIFNDNNYKMYKGEILGLRAFLHLEMLRIFSPSPKANANAMAVPYVTQYDKVVTTQKTVNETVNLIIADLLEAEQLLKDSDPMLDKELEYTTRWARRYYFNYYAVVGTLARAYMYKGDNANALTYAEIIIDEGEQNDSNFGWTHYTTMNSQYENEVNRLFSGECLFYLNIKDFNDVVKYHFTASSSNNTFTPSDTKADQIYEKSSKGYGNDYRMLKSFAYDGANKYLWKYHQYENGVCTDIMPVIRKSEAYYIAAEVLKESNPTRAIELLNLVREARNLSLYPLPETLTTEEIQDEIGKEYRKEFLAEGQMFYYYKRLDANRIEGAGVNAQSVYVLPMPDNEIEFGERK